MNANIQEESRTLREFYPEPSLRHRVHYAFAHRFIPLYVQQNPYAFFSYLYNHDLPGGVMNPSRFIQSRWSGIFEPNMGLAPRFGNGFEQGMVFRRVTDLALSIQELSGRASALITMPAPEQPAEAYFVCPVLLASAAQVTSWPDDVRARVFTLEAECSERPGNKMGVVCEWTSQGEHRNFGFAVPANQEAFLQAVVALLETPDAPARGSFTRAEDGTPGAIALCISGNPPQGQRAKEPKE